MYQNKLETGFYSLFLNKLRVNFINLKKKQMQSLFVICKERANKKHIGIDPPSQETVLELC